MFFYAGFTVAPKFLLAAVLSVTFAVCRYGDKAPKFFLARVLSVVWMFMGVSVMAYLTAIMTTALTSGTVTDHKIIANKEVRSPLFNSWY